MFEKSLSCPVCERTYPLEVRFRCSCGGNLEILYDYQKLKKVDFKDRPFNHARYMEFYPVRELVSMEEGGTPLLESRSLGKKLGKDLHFKNETVNPTASFKDRGSSVEVAKAREVGKRVIVASTGNMGASVAAYSARAGLRCTVVVPQHIAKTKVWQIMAYGARVVRVHGDYTAAAHAAESEKGSFLLGDYLYRREGTKSVGFEIAEQIRPEYVFCPVGNGNLIAAVWKAFKEFRRIGYIKKVPRLIGVQASGCSPVVQAFAKGRPLFVEKAETIASAIECASPLDGVKALQAIKESKGFALSVTDHEILKARELLAQKEGIFAEPSGAVPLAGLIKARERVDGRIVCIVGGHGLKDPRWFRV